MNRRLLLVAACVVLPSLPMGAQNAGSADDRGNSADRARSERESKKKRAVAGGFGMGVGIDMFAFGTADENVMQHDWCIGACTTLQRKDVSAASFVAPGLAVAAAAHENAGAPNGKLVGVMGLLESLGHVSDQAIEAVEAASVSHGAVNTEVVDQFGHSKVPAARAPKSVETESGSADGSDMSALLHSNDYLTAVHGCVTNCDAAGGESVLSDALTPPVADLFHPNADVGNPFHPTADLPVITNPEPGTVALTTFGLIALAGVARRKRQTR